MNKLTRVLSAVCHQFKAYVPRANASTLPAETAPSKPATKVPAPVEEKHVGLMEFFDLKANWLVNEVRVGRSWKKEELRIKSNQDLHKLWYVLLKERNMLLTMQQEMMECWVAFPSPERLDKVHESMVNLEEVVRERNRAYYLLETGESGERPGYLTTNRIGMHNFYKMTEHVEPLDYNSPTFIRMAGISYSRREVAKFRMYLNEQIWIRRLKAKRKDRRAIIQLYKRFPDLDEEALQQLYPDENLEIAKQSKKAQGHFAPKTS